MSSYFAPLVLQPTVIDGPGKYVTRCGETVEITQSSHRHDFGCYGIYGDNVKDRWHKSGRIFACRESANDVVAKIEATLLVSRDSLAQIAQ